jgi:hypothetical protein
MNCEWIWGSTKHMYNKDAFDKLRSLNSTFNTLKDHEKITSKFDYVIAIPGLLTGLTDHFFKDLNSQAKYLPKSKIRVYICTWSWIYNKRIVDYIKKQEYSNLDIKIRIVDYESQELLDYFATIFKNWGVEFKGNVNRFTFKRYISQFIYAKCIEFVKEKEKEDTLVLKIRSATEIRTHNSKISLDELHNRNLSELWYSSNTEDRLKLGNLDRFVLSSVSSSGLVGDILFYSSVKNLHRVFGSTQDTADRMSEYYIKEFKKYGGEKLPKDEIELDHLHEFANLLMYYEGSGGLSYLINSSGLVHFKDNNLVSRLFGAIGAPAVPYMSLFNHRLAVEGKVFYKEDTVKKANRFLVNQDLGQKSLI